MGSSVNDVSRVARPPRGRIRPRAEEVRRRLLDAAMRVFAERGFADASIDEIAAAAGFTKGAVYSRFTSKDDLFFELLTEQISERINLVGHTRTPEPATAEEVIRSMGEKLSLLLMDSRPWQMLFLEFWQRAAREPEVQARYADQRAMLRQLISRFIEDEATRFGINLCMAPDDLATLVLALCNGLFIEEAATPGTVRPALLSEVLVRLLVNPPGRP